MNLRVPLLPCCLHAMAEHSPGARALQERLQQLFENGVYSPHKFRPPFFDVFCPVWQFGICVVPIYHTG